MEHSTTVQFQCGIFFVTTSMTHCLQIESATTLNLHCIIMKFLVILLLTWLAVASANPLYELGESVGLGDFVDDLSFATDDQTTVQEVKKQLKEHFKEFLQKIKDAIDQGKGIKDDVLDKAKEIRDKLKKIGEELDKKGKELLERILDHGKDYIKKILDRLGVDDKEADHHVHKIMQAEGDSDMISQLKDKFQDIVKKVKDAFENGKSITDGLEKLEQLRKKLKEYNIDIGDFGGEFLQKLKDKVKDYWNKLKDKLTSKRSADIDVFGMLERLKKLIKEKFNPEKLKEIVEKYFGKGSEIAEQLINLLKEHGEKRKQKILDWIDRILGDKEEKRSSNSEVSEKFKDFFKDLGLDIKERFTKFGNWVKEQYKKGLQKGKDKVDNLRKIAKEFLDQTKHIGKEIAEEALEFFKLYKKDLGIIFDDVSERIKEIMKED
ncbi:uncharacterized protein CDAR_60731 [Caerostris darwini]|uniref:Laminin subunit alpha-2 n=1 Tax=Caerostris darwini TaxID=1538125 RepID=A0AAV4VIN2_9ARAC|nr:uncharacterized protein CDAR_60731 [Caerostris darwini]